MKWIHLALSVLWVFLATVGRAQDQEPKGPRGPAEFLVEFPYGTKTCLKKTSQGDTILYRAEGRILSTGEVFENTQAPGGQPYVWMYLPHTLIEGLYEGMSQMCSGEIRRITIPSSMAWGNKAHTDRITGIVVPPGADVQYLITMVQVQDTPSQDNMFDYMSKGEETISVKKLTERILYELSTDRAQKQMPFKYDEKVAALMEVVVTLGDKNKDSQIDRKEFATMALFNIDDKNLKQINEELKLMSGESPISPSNDVTKEEL